LKPFDTQLGNKFQQLEANERHQLHQEEVRPLERFFRQLFQPVRN
jgi:hypothetical protein